MGQRHQVYIRLHQKDNQMIGFHNHWSYGTLPLSALKRILTFNKKAQSVERLTENSPWLNSEDKLQAILSCDYQKGFYSRYSDITKEMTVESNRKTFNPTMGDNNDGITVIDLTKKKIGYCFMNIGEGDSSIRQAPPLEPLTAKQYLKLYYNEGTKEWKSYGADSLISCIDKNSRLLSVDDCIEMFPDMMKDLTIERNKIKRIKKADLPTLMGQLTYDINIRLMEKRMAA